LLDPAIFAGALLLYALAMPLGLARVEGASQVAAGIALDTGTQPAFFACSRCALASFCRSGTRPCAPIWRRRCLCALAIVWSAGCVC
jgi:hypothetical protein